ncbi:hypothetical protein HD806DRAFT_528410 [Xylariaceae sp. AK1471]|nr:hypothetical protein HD806DRAFT_528410 [Xylariaceae sp. AK1471]
MSATDYDIRKGWATVCRTKDRGHLLSNRRLLIEVRIIGDTEITLRGIRINLQEVKQMIINYTGSLIIEAAVPSRLGVFIEHVIFSPVSVPANTDVFLKDLCDCLPLTEAMSPVASVPFDRVPTTASSELD